MAYLMIKCETDGTIGHGWGDYEPPTDPEDHGGFVLHWSTSGPVIASDLEGHEDHDLVVLGEEA